VALISAISTGTLVPLIYGWWLRRQPDSKEEAKDKQDRRISEAATDAVDAVRDVLAELRSSRDECLERNRDLMAENARLRGELVLARRDARRGDDEARPTWGAP
jgi:uncharacterized membrane protein